MTLGLLALLTLGSCSVDPDPALLPSTTPTPTPSTTPSTSSSTSPSPETSTPDSTGGNPNPSNPSGSVLSTDVNNLLGEALSTSSTLKLTGLDGIAGPDGGDVVGKSTVDYDASSFQSAVTDSSGNTEYAFFKKDADGKAVEVYLDAHKDSYAKVKEAVVGDWSALGWVKDSFEHAQFVNESGNVYRYNGLEASNLIYHLSKIDISSLEGNPVIESVKVKVNDNRVTSLKAVSSSFDREGQKAKYELDVSVEPAVREIKVPEPLIDETKSASKAVANLFKGETISYRAIATNDLSPSDQVLAVVNDEGVYLEKKIGGVLTRSGYQLIRSNGEVDPETGPLAVRGWLKYDIDNAGNVTYVNNISGYPDIDPNLTYEAMAPFALSPNAFNYGDENSTLLEQVPYLKNTVDHIPFKLAAAGEIVEHTMKLKGKGQKDGNTIEDDQIAEISYDIVKDGRRGKEIITFEYGGSLSNRIPLDGTISGLLFNSALTVPAKTGWKEEKSNSVENKSVRDHLLEFFNDASKADILPYFYDQGAAGKWHSFIGDSPLIQGQTFKGVQIGMLSDATISPTDFYTKLVETLKAQGFVWYTRPGGTAYVKDGVVVALNDKSPNKEFFVTNVPAILPPNIS